MTRYKLILEYDGGPFVGWQMQENGLSVQGHLAAAIHKMTGEQVTPSGAGRTDSGVHARGQVAHFDLSKDWDIQKLREGLNYHLKPKPVAVLNVEEVGDDFDARFSAIQRHYEYVIINRRAPLTLEAMRAWHIPQPLDETAMHEAAQALLGKHDFTTFRSVHCQAKSPIKSINIIGVERGDETIVIKCSARSFMHNQVRSIVGSLVQVGLGKWPISELQEALNAKDRSRCGTVAPAHGLYFMAIDYE